MKDAYQIILGPVITEKSNLRKEAENRLTLRVHPDANKREIKEAVEKLFKVTVLGVRTQNFEGKRKRFGRWMGKRNDFKRALVRLKAGDRVEFFEGV